MDCLLFFRKIDVNLIDLVEWAIATHGMYESPFCVGNVHSLSYFQFQGIDGLYVSYKQCH